MMRVASDVVTFMYGASVAMLATVTAVIVPFCVTVKILRLAAAGTEATHNFVPSCVNLYPVGFVASRTGLEMRAALSLPSKFGSANAVVSSTFDRCGISARLTGCLMSVSESGSATPLMSVRPFRLTVPTTGLVTWISVWGPYGRGAAGARLQ